MSSFVDPYELARLGMELFCEKHDWILSSISKNPKNSKQWLAECFDETGAPEFILITESGKYYRFVSRKNWEHVPFLKVNE